MVLYRVWQGVLSVLAVGAFLALEYIAGRDVDPLVPVILSWVAVVAPVLLAIGWVVKKQYWRTLALAALVAAVRVCLERTLSDFLETAGWFLIGAVVLVLIIALVTRWVRGSSSKKSSQTAKTAEQKPKGTSTTPDAAKDATVVAPPQLMQFARVETPPAVVTPGPEAQRPEPVKVEPVKFQPAKAEAAKAEGATIQPAKAEGTTAKQKPDPKEGVSQRCEKCGAPNTDEDAVFCRSCGASLTR